MGCPCIFKLENAPFVGVYLHYAPEEDTIERILGELRAYARCPSDDPEYALARLIEQLVEFAGPRESTGIGVGLMQNLDDSGPTYTISTNWSYEKDE